MMYNFVDCTRSFDGKTLFQPDTVSVFVSPSLKIRLVFDNAD